MRKSRITFLILSGHNLESIAHWDGENVLYAEPFIVPTFPLYRQPLCRNPYGAAQLEKCCPTYSGLLFAMVLVLCFAQQDLPRLNHIFPYGLSNILIPLALYDIHGKICPYTWVQSTNLNHRTIS